MAFSDAEPVMELKLTKDPSPLFTSSVPAFPPLLLAATDIKDSSSRMTSPVRDSRVMVPALE